MVTKLKCLEPVTAMGCYVAALVAGGADGGMTALGILGAAKLTEVIATARRKFGLQDKAHLARHQKAIQDEWSSINESDWAVAADLNSADGLLEKHLLNAIPPAEELGQTVVAGTPYPDRAADKIMAKLAKQPNCQIFDPKHHAFSKVADRFARSVIVTSLKAALSDPQYTQEIQTWFLIDIGKGVHDVQEQNTQTHAQIAALQAQVKALLAALETRIELPEPVLRDTILQELDAKPGSSPEELAQVVVTFKSQHDRLQARVAQIETFDNQLTAIKSEARDAVDVYDHEKAARLYAKARALIDERNAEGAKQAAKFAQAEAEALMLERDWRGAAEVWMDAARKLGPYDAKAAGYLHVTAGIALYEFGQKYGGGALDAAIIAYRAAQKVYTREAMPVECATTQNNLGNALWAQGERLDGAAGVVLLGEAVAAYRAALEVLTRDAMPVKWAATQNNLGNALRVQGARLDGRAGVALLGEAVAAYRAALEVHTRAAMPVDWAATQNNLGNALWVQGNRLDGAAGVALLGEAVEAYRAALEVHTRDAMQVHWAGTQNNLGNALQEQGERLDGASGVALLGEAVEAYRAALEVHTRDAMPVDWAKAQNNLGAALQVQGNRLDGAAGVTLLGEAVEAYRAAQTVYTRDAMPVDWAATQNNLGNALQTQGNRLDGAAAVALLGEAVAAYRAALEVHTRAAMPVDWAMTCENLAEVQRVLAAKDTDNRCDHLATAREAVTDALIIYTPEHMPYDYGTATKLLADIEAQIAEHCPDCAAS